MVGVLLGNFSSAIKTMDSLYLVLGPSNGDQTTYWNSANGWTEEESNASVYSAIVLTMPLPTGTTDLLEVSPKGDIRGLLMPLPSGRVGGNFFEKVS